MAGNWLKIDVKTLDKPEVVMMADKLGIDQDAVLGKLLRFWAWCDNYAKANGTATVTKRFVDYHVKQDGFADALLEVQWLCGRDGVYQIPKFDRHLAPSSREATSGINLESRRKKYKYPTLNDAKSAAVAMGVTPKQAELWWHTREASSWMRGSAGGGTSPIGNWQSDMRVTAPYLESMHENGSTNNKRADRNNGTANQKGGGRATAPRPPGV